MKLSLHGGGPGRGSVVTTVLITGSRVNIGVRHPDA
jgi:hypothetical protein